MGFNRTAKPKQGAEILRLPAVVNGVRFQAQQGARGPALAWEAKIHGSHSRHQRQGGRVNAAPETPSAVGAARRAGLTGTKFGCGMAQCGACTVHVDGQPVRSCVTPIAGLSGVQDHHHRGPGRPHPLQQAWVKHDVPQCGYCQSGQIMSAAALLEQNKAPTDEDIDNAMSGNICRCGTYQRIRAAIKDAAGTGPPPASRTPTSTRPSPPLPARPAGEPADERALQQADAPRGPSRRDVMWSARPWSAAPCWSAARPPTS
jgi:isoquinoline 1-oxidoreductase alpha subunit